MGTLARALSSVLAGSLLVVLPGCGSGDDEVVGGSPIAPVVTDIMPMTGGLHVVWSLDDNASCDTIEGERKTDTTPYAVVFSVPGNVDNKHDGTATEKIAYTYRLRCKLGATYSAYSNEKSGTPE